MACLKFWFTEPREEFEKVISKSCNMSADELIDLAEMQSKIYQALSSGSSNKIPDILLSYATSIIEAAELLQPTKPAVNTNHQTYPPEIPQTCLNRPLAQSISDKHRQGCIQNCHQK